MSTDINKEKLLLKQISELESELRKIKKQKKYGLVWENKPEEIVEACKQHVPILRLKEKKAGIDPVVVTDESKDDHILIEGDNYHALSVLNYTHKGKIDVIYIDPPYNTGNQSWKYNNDYVEKDDPWRHSKWISMMDKRIRLAKELLSPKGSMIVAIDDYEVHALGLLLEEYFPMHERDLVIVEHHPQGAGSNTVSRTHEYAFIITPPGVGFLGRKREEGESNWSLKRTGQGENNWRENRPKQFFAVLVDAKKGEVVGVGPEIPRDAKKYPLGKTPEGFDRMYPMDKEGKERCWRYNRATMQKLIDNGFIEYSKKGALSVKKDAVNAVPVFSIWKDSKYNAGTNGSAMLTDIMGTTNTFQYPKSLWTVYDMIELIHADSDSIFLDFFAGSGTTGHAVLELNKDGGDRKFILCTNNENNICEEVTYERIKRVIKGYKNKKGEKVEGLGGNLRYYKTDLVDIEKLQHTPDRAKVKITYQAGEMIALRENTLNETDKSDWWQIFEGGGKATAIYFKEDKEKLDELVKFLEKKKMPVVLYIFSWGKNEYRTEYSSENIRVEDIPEPILEVYKEINRL
jgi:adenine-specific DNA-methyltransferase